MCIYTRADLTDQWSHCSTRTSINGRGGQVHMPDWSGTVNVKLNGKWEGFFLTVYSAIRGWIDCAKLLYDDTTHGHWVSVELKGNVRDIGILEFVRYVLVWIIIERSFTLHDCIMFFCLTAFHFATLWHFLGKVGGGTHTGQVCFSLPFPFYVKWPVCFNPSINGKFDTKFSTPASCFPIQRSFLQKTNQCQNYPFFVLIFYPLDSLNELCRVTLKVKANNMQID